MMSLLTFIYCHLYMLLLYFLDVINVHFHRLKPLDLFNKLRWSNENADLQCTMPKPKAYLVLLLSWL